MSRWSSRCFSSLLLAAAALPAILLPAHAFVQVDPARLLLPLSKQEASATTATVSVTNTETVPTRYKLFPMYWTHDDAGNLMFTDKPDAHAYTGTIRISPREFELQPGDTQTIRLAFPSIATQPDGEYHVAIMVEDQKTQEQRLDTHQQGVSAALTLRRRFAVVGYLFQGSGLVPQLAVAQHTSDVKRGTWISHLTLKNDGQRHYRGTGSLLISKGDSVIKEVPIEGLRDLVVLPGSTQRIDTLLLNAEELKQADASQYQVELFLKEKDNPTNKNQVISQPLPKP
jgi:P pilus assembly chaperone PapD